MSFLHGFSLGIYFWKIQLKHNALEKIKRGKNDEKSA